MIEIHFEEEVDAKTMYRQFSQCTNQAYNETYIYMENSTLVFHIPSAEYAYVEDVLIPALIHFILTVKEDKWIVSILRDSFYYEDAEERHHILHIAHSILDGRRKGVLKQGIEEKREVFLAASLREFVKDPVSFSFESYVKFRLKHYMSYLIRLTELAIDEYKLEQEYQAFVETLRQQVYKRKSRLSCLHLVFNGNFIFYDDKGARLNQDKLLHYLDCEVVSHQEVYIDTNVIAPLLSIAPKKICLYTTHTDHNMVITIQNVFQERVKVYSICEFEKIRRDL
ncbi:putative sporulation protein YtxC [Microbacteriaceae bacterium 4G12]